MVIDILKNASRYYALSDSITTALDYLRNTGLKNIAPGKYEIDGENIFAIVQEYETLDATNEQMESHKKYIDVQYMIDGAELVGHTILKDQVPSTAYDEATDFMLFSEPPSFFSKLESGMFMIFFPTDLHMPCIKTEKPAVVKKIVVKVRI
ncbi:MAG: YhcH/YjgK/YiaL family protein [Panacibacter sp.]